MCIYIVGMWLYVCVCGVYVVVIVALCVHVCSGRWLHTVGLCVHMRKSTLGVILQEPFILLSETISHWPGVCSVGVSQGGWPMKPRNQLPQHWDPKRIPTCPTVHTGSGDWMQALIPARQTLSAELLSQSGDCWTALESGSIKCLCVMFPLDSIYW